MPKQTTDQPLGPQDIADVRNALAQCATAKALIEKAEGCGYDCRAHRAIADGLEQRLQALLHTFGGRVKE